MSTSSVFPSEVHFQPMPFPKGFASFEFSSDARLAVLRRDFPTLQKQKARKVPSFQASGFPVGVSKNKKIMKKSGEPAAHRTSSFRFGGSANQLKNEKDGIEPQRKKAAMDMRIPRQHITAHIDARHISFVFKRLSSSRSFNYCIPICYVLYHSFAFLRCQHFFE